VSRLWLVDQQLIGDLNEYRNYTHLTCCRMFHFYPIRPRPAVFVPLIPAELSFHPHSSPQNFISIPVQSSLAAMLHFAKGAP